MLRRHPALFASLLALAQAQAPRLSGQEAPQTSDIYERYRAGIFQVVIIEESSGTRASYGSGFFVDAEGRAVTNYHVVASVVHEPEAYRAEIHAQGEVPRPLEVLAVDVVNDLAVVRDAQQPRLYLELAAVEPQQGARLYSFGHPRDLGAAVVEGTFNGRVETSFYDRYHLTGAVNPGMSGGPTIDGEGRVVGVNVAIMRGNLLGFLVPVGHARDLLAAAGAAGSAGAAPDLLAQVRAQLLVNQEALAAWMLAHLKTARLGHFRVPRVDSSLARCWGDRRARSFENYRKTQQGCALEAAVFVTDEHDTGGVAMDHTLLASDKLNTIRFYDLLQQEFSEAMSLNRAGREDVGNYACHTDFVDRDGLRLKAVLCLRAYRKLPGLYDAVFKAASVSENHTGLATELRLAGFAPETVQRLTRRYLEEIAWSPE